MNTDNRYHWPHKDLLDVTQLSAQDTMHLLDLAASFQEINSRPVKKVPTLKGKTVVLFFVENSTRTKTSFDVAGKRLSADTYSLAKSGSSLNKGETLKDTGLTLQAMGPDVIVIRHPSSGAARFLAELLPCGIVNGGDGWHAHPTQALLDCYSLRQAWQNRFAGRTLLILGDTNSCLSAIAAKRLHIPIFHMEAGNRCFDECLPEETNRRIVDHISDVNMCYSEHARRYLNAEGTAKERTFVTGSPMAEVLHANLAKIEASDVLERLGLEPHKYMLLSAHREENIDTEKNFIDLFTSINHLAQTYDMPILYSCHPRSKKRLDAMGFQLDERVKLHEPLGFHDYNHLQMNAFAVVSDSGTLPEESSFFTSVGHPFPAVCIRTSTERPEALDKGCFVLAGISEGGVEQAVATAVAMNANGDNGIPVPYYTEDVSTKVVKIIQSYTGVVNKMVWRKY